MSVIKIDLGKDFRRVRDEMEQVIDDMLQARRSFAACSGARWAPPMDLYETPSEIIVLAEMAGLKSEEIQVLMDGDILKISGVRANPRCEPNRRVHQMEIDFGPFERKVRLRMPIDAERVQAVYRDGFLTIRIPKAQELSREISVKSVK
jgi:HSP20 family protein